MIAILAREDAITVKPHLFVPHWALMFIYKLTEVQTTKIYEINFPHCLYRIDIVPSILPTSVRVV